MIEQNSGILRTVAWSEMFPWLSIFRTFRLAVGFRVLVMGALGIMLTVSGWAVLGNVFSVSDDNLLSTSWLKPFISSPLKELNSLVPDEPVIIGPRVAALSEHYTYMRPKDPMFSTLFFLNQPMREGLGREVNLKSLICLVFCGLWSMAVWSIFGAAICRISAVQLAANERITFASAMRHAGQKFLAYFSAPLVPLAGIALAALPVAAIGLIMYVGGLGVFLAALAWPALLVCGLIMALLVLGLFFGWPLMWGTISVEGSDSFDAMSRSYAYVFQAPLQYLFYAVVAGIFGSLGWFLVQNFASGVIWLTYWAASWGATDAQVQALMPGGTASGLALAGAWLIALWTSIVKLLAVGYLFSFFWTASVAIYFLLRRTVDATEMDEVFLDGDADEQPAELPTILSDEVGAPNVASENAEPQGEEKTDGE
ncbi:MAG: hypothetical protein ACWGMZ_09815 [Thermoguttaceae bacterium]